MEGWDVGSGVAPRDPASPPEAPVPMESSVLLRGDGVRWPVDPQGSPLAWGFLCFQDFLPFLENLGKLAR